MLSAQNSLTNEIIFHKSKKLSQTLKHTYTVTTASQEMLNKFFQRRETAQIENMGQHEGKSVREGVSEGRQAKGDQSFRCKQKDAEGLLALTQGKRLK